LEAAVSPAGEGIGAIALFLPHDAQYLCEQFPKKRSTGRTAIAGTLLNLAAECQRFFAPYEAPEMLATFLPRLNGTKLDTVIATQAFLSHFLPLSHPTSWLPAVFKLWESFNSTFWDEQCVLSWAVMQG
jgi:proteasome activator subunit 4